MKIFPSVMMEERIEVITMQPIGKASKCSSSRKYPQIPTDAYTIISVECTRQKTLSNLRFVGFLRSKTKGKTSWWFTKQKMQAAMACMSCENAFQPSTENQFTLPQSIPSIPLNSTVLPVTLVVKPTKKVMTMMAILTATAITPITDIFCSSAIYFFRIKIRFKAIAPSTTQILAMLPVQGRDIPDSEQVSVVLPPGVQKPALKTSSTIWRTNLPKITWKQTVTPHGWMIMHISENFLKAGPQARSHISLQDLILNLMMSLDIRYMPIYEKRPVASRNSKKGTTPTSFTRYGRLNMPEPIALARRAKIDPLIAPAFSGAKARCTKVRLSRSSALSSSSAVTMLVSETRLLRGLFMRFDYRIQHGQADRHELFDSIGLYFMNNTKVRLGEGLVGFRRTQLQQMRRLERKAKTEGNQKRQERQTMELRAKTHLFQEDEVHNQKQINKSYSNTKHQREAQRQYFTSAEEPITAFQDHLDSLRRQEIQPQPTLKTIKARVQRTKISSELSTHQIYWNRRHHPHHQQIMVLRPAILNPTITVQLNEESELQASPKAKYVQSFQQIESRKDFEAAIREYAKKTKEIYNNHDVSRVRVQERNRKAVSISKRLAKLKSKSTCFIHEEQHRNQMINQLEKLTAPCELDLQIKCLNSQKQPVDNSRPKAEQSNKDLQLKIRNLITIEKNKIQVASQKLVQEDQTDNQDNKMEKLLQIHKRSKSCVASTFKRPENKKIKIATILSKLVKFKAEEDQRKRKRQDEEAQFNKSLEFVRFHMRMNEQKEKKPLLHIQQEQVESLSAKKALLTSIKNFCKDKNAHLPIVNLSKGSSIVP